MSQARITFERNEKTGKRELNIDYESDPSAMPHEHEDEHRDFVKKVIDLKKIKEEEEVAVTRQEPEVKDEPTDMEEEERKRERERAMEKRK